MLWTVKLIFPVKQLVVLECQAYYNTDFRATKISLNFLDYSILVVKFPWNFFRAGALAQTETVV